MPQNPVERPLVDHPGSPFRRVRPGIPLPTNVQLSGTRLPYSLHRNPQRLSLGFNIQHPLDDVTLVRPQMQQASVGLA